MGEARDYSDVSWPWDGDPNWAQPREGATYDPGEDDNWALACKQCELQFPVNIKIHAVKAHWDEHFAETEEEPEIALNLVWIGLGTPPKANR